MHSKELQPRASALANPKVHWRYTFNHLCGTEKGEEARGVFYSVYFKHFIYIKNKLRINCCFSVFCTETRPPEFLFLLDFKYRLTLKLNQIPQCLQCVV